MIIYTKRCMACTDRQNWKRIKQYAQKNKLPLEERRIGSNKEWQEEANSHGLELPFVFINGKAIKVDQLEVL